ncbi:hypothetical protein MYB54_14965 [Pectobacterium sp. 21LCBS03]|nr:hypothetical protein [Pectobacterium sp. 21LCBS03]UPY93893.1 hypothetical protein MYB54_14965 [Pectobacterium sp. 21LCBS03]
MSQLLEWENLDFPARVALKSKSEKSFLNFTRLWFELLQGDRLLMNWHHKMMVSKIDDLVAGRLQPRNLIINVPPGGTKTEFVSVHLPAYINMLVQTEKLRKFRNLKISFADTLVKSNSRRTRDIILLSSPDILNHHFSSPIRHFPPSAPVRYINHYLNQPLFKSIVALRCLCRIE